jgi:hypothetical protein
MRDESGRLRPPPASVSATVTVPASAGALPAGREAHGVALGAHVAGPGVSCRMTACDVEGGARSERGTGRRLLSDFKFCMLAT